MKKRVASLMDVCLDRDAFELAISEDLQGLVPVIAQRYQAFFASTNDAVVILGPGGEILDVNPQFVRWSGFPYDVLVLKKLEDFLDERGCEEVFVRIQALLAGRQRKYPIEGMLISRSGRKRDVEMGLSLLRNQYGYDRAILAVMRDVNRRKKTEQHLARKVEELERVFDTVPTILVVVDEKRRIRKVNGVGLETFGRGEEQIIGKRLGEALRCMNRLDSPRGCGFGIRCRVCSIHKSLSTCLGKGEAVRHAEEAIIGENSGSTISFRINAVPLSGRRKRWGVVSLEDITDKKKAEIESVRLHNTIVRANAELKKTLEELAKSQDRLIESKKLEKIGLLASGLAHNLKSPLTGIKGYAQLLKMDHEELEDLDIIIEEVGRMESIVNNLMMKSRKDHENVEEALNLNDLLRIELEFLSANMFFKHEVEKKVALDKNLPTVLGVYSHFSQSVGNIIQNALDAMHGVEKKRLTVRTRHDDRYVYVEIGDTGCGVPEALQEKIFDFFFTTKPAPKKKKGEEPVGTGLGLSSANYFIRQYGGSIRMKSRVGKGSTVTVRVPYVSKSGVSLPKVLIVDDDDCIVEILTKLCQDLGVEAYSAPDGMKALALYGKLEPRVIIADLCMPGLTGREMMSEVRRLKPDQKVIYISGYFENPVFQDWLERESWQASLCAVLKKPFPLDELKKVLQKMVFE